MIRPDFVLQPSGERRNTWNWTVVDLKRPDVTLFASPRFHMRLSAQVNGLITQLRDYADFFADPRNFDEPRKRFGGVVPKPNLVGIIGRLPTDHRDEYAVLRSRSEGVSITTFDEVLELRRYQVDLMRSIGF